MSNKDFYRAFEDKYRGSRELIKERISVYLPFVLPLKNLYPNVKALDIGCGRGEWLELLNENSMSAKGIDLDEGMLEACKILSLDVTQGNGIAYFKELSDESLTIISAFHVVEHISFEDLQSLVQDSLRVLKPGGILILETPNPENIKVATENFYLDPTHIKPIPSNLLSFLPEFYGYSRTKILRLQESKEVLNQESINLREVIEGVSPDYAIVAQKEANKEILREFDDVFSKEYGVSLDSLTDKFENRLLIIETKASEAETKASEAEIKASEAETKATHVEINYYKLLNSNSWKIMKPYRKLGDFLKWFFANMKNWILFKSGSRPRRIFKNFLFSLKDFINNRPKLKNKVLDIIDTFPVLKERLKKIKKQNYSQNNIYNSDDSIKGLSDMEIEIYNDIKKEISKQKGKN